MIRLTTSYLILTSNISNKELLFKNISAKAHVSFHNSKNRNFKNRQ